MTYVIKWCLRSIMRSTKVKINKTSGNRHSFLKAMMPPRKDICQRVSELASDAASMVEDMVGCKVS